MFAVFDWPYDKNPEYVDPGLKNDEGKPGGGCSSGGRSWPWKLWSLNLIGEILWPALVTFTMRVEPGDGD